MQIKKLFNLGSIICAITIATGCSDKAAESSAPEERDKAVQTQQIDTSPIAQIEVSNPSEFARNDQALYFSFYDLGVDAKGSDAANLSMQLNGVAIPSQIIDADGDGNKDGILSVVDLTPGATENITLLPSETTIDAGAPKRTQAEISHKVGGEWQERVYIGGEFENVTTLTPPTQHTDHSFYIRYEGPGIESDKVGYRIYLDERNGFDIFGKKTKAMVLQDVGQDGFDSYHEMSDWGLDILKVGEAVGVGGFGYWNGNELVRTDKIFGWDVAIKENGNLFSSFATKYKGWEIENKTINIDSLFSMTAGSRLMHVKLQLDKSLPDMAVGIVKHPQTEFLVGEMNITGKAYSYIATWGKQSLAEDNLGMAILFKKEDLKELAEDANNHVAIMRGDNNRLDYYLLAAWEQEPNGIKTQEQFVKYLEQEVERLTRAPRIRLKTRLAEAQKQFPITMGAALGWSQRMADSELEENTLQLYWGGRDVGREQAAGFDYDTVGLRVMAYDELAKTVSMDKYKDVIHKTTATFVNDDGTLNGYEQSKYNIDSINAGRNILRLYEQTNEEKYKQAATILRQQLKDHPKTSEGAFWHKKRYPWQLWLDGVYMGLPFLAHYSMLFEDGHSLDEVVNEFKITRAKLRDPKTGLYYHAWDEKKQQEWADPETGLSKYFWARGMGWLTMALVDVLDFIPKDDTAHRQPLLDMIQEIAPALANYQDDTGTWWQILDVPGKTGNYREASASAMFTYFFAKAINQGYLPNSFKPTAVKAYEGLVKEFVIIHTDGNISFTNNCLVAGLGYGRDGSYEYYLSEPVVHDDSKAIGPFILAGIEISQVLSNNHSSNNE